MYSSPPRHGAEIAELVLSDPQLYDAWKVRLGRPAAGHAFMPGTCAQRDQHASLRAVQPAVMGVASHARSNQCPRTCFTSVCVFTLYVPGMQVELKGMADRIITMRTKLHESLKAVGAPGGWDHIVNQIGALVRMILFWLGSSCSGSPDRQRPVASFHVVSAPRDIGVAFLAADMCLPGMRTTCNGCAKALSHALLRDLRCVDAQECSASPA